MIEAFGIQLGTVFQGGTFMAVLAVLGLILRSYIIGMPARAKVASEREANLLHERAEEMIGMRERLKVVEEQLALKSRLSEAERTMYRHRIANLTQAFMALLMLLRKGISVEEAVAEIERLRSEQHALETAEAAMFHSLGLTPEMSDPQKSAALNAAEHTKRATEAADALAEEARKEVERAEVGEGDKT